MALRMSEQAGIASNRAEEYNRENANSTTKELTSPDYANSFRVIIQYPLVSELTLLNVEQELESVDIIVENVGPGGLRFLANIHLELDQEIIYSVESEFLEDKIHIPGNIIWKEEISNGLFQYGAHFETPEQTRPFLNQLFGV